MTARKDPISLGKTIIIIREKVEYCCRWSQEEDVTGITESLVYGKKKGINSILNAQKFV